MKKREGPQDLFTFECIPVPSGGTRHPAIVRIICGALAVVMMFLYRLCCAVGIMTLYDIHRIARRLRRQEKRLHHSLRSSQARLTHNVRARVRRTFEPVRQFFMIFSYAYFARHPAHGRERIPMQTVVRVTFLKLLHSIWRLCITLINIAAPVAGIWVLVMTVGHYTSTHYGLIVEYNGESIGRVASEAQFDEARRKMMERLGGQQAEQADVTLTLLPMPNTGYTDVDTMADRMLRISGKDLFEGYGVYIDNRFRGALEDGAAILNSLNARLDSASSGAPGETVQFNHRFSLQKALYPASAETTVEYIEGLFNSQLSAEKKYTVVQGDSPSLIAQKNGIRTAELIRLNPEIETTLLVGQELVIAHSVPYLRIQRSYTESTVEEIPFTTTREVDEEKETGYLEEVDEGRPGQRRIVSSVTYLDDELVSREEMSRTVIRQPVDRKIIVGGKRPPSSSGSQTPMDTTNDILDIGTNTDFIWPVDGGRVTMPIWGYYGHTGNDITGIPQGTTIRASASGTVVYSGYTPGGYGRHIIIDHGNGLRTLYAHNSANYVQVGDRVVQGQKIGAVGMTGNATGFHCHFEINQNGVHLDARNYVGSASPR